MLGQVDRLVEALRRVDPALLSGADCARLAERLATAEKACAGLRARAAARAADCGAHRGLGYAQPADWLAKLSGSSVGEARAALETAAVLPEVPEVREALAAGSLSLAQAREIALTEGERPGSASVLLDVARRRGLQAVREEARRMRVAAVDPEELHRRQRAARSFRHWRDSEGMVCFRGALAPEDGIPFVNRLDAECDRIRRAARREGSAEPWEAQAADALVQLTAGSGKGRSRSADVVVVVDLRAWRRGRAKEGESCHIVGGGPVPVSLAKELAVDAFLKAVVHDGVEIKSVKHLGRHIPAELRTALDLGAPPGFEGTACADGCGRRHGLEWDHVDPVAHGGPTSYDNLRPRCWGCHHDKTERDRRAGLLGGRGYGESARAP
jgi:hypothetical protein